MTPTAPTHSWQVMTTEPRVMRCPYCQQEHEFELHLMYEAGAQYPVWTAQCPAVNRIVYAKVEGE